MRIVFLGTSEFAVPALEALVKAGYEIVAVVTQPDMPVGRGLKMEAPAVKVKADEFGLRVLQPPTLRLSLGLTQGLALGELHADVGVCVAYGKIIPKEVLELFPHGILNIHPSLLPKYRGPSPIQTAICNGEMETGVTIMLLDAEMDHGPILTQKAIPLDHKILFTIVHNILAQKGAQLLLEVLPKWLTGEITPRAQDHARATFTKMLEREDGRIDWHKPAEQIERMVRAYDRWPGTWTTYNGKRLKVFRSSLLHAATGCASNPAPGYVWKTETGHIAVNCNPGAIILEKIQREGKKAITGADFLHGSSNFLGNILR